MFSAINVGVGSLGEVGEIPADCWVLIIIVDQQNLCQQVGRAALQDGHQRAQEGGAGLGAEGDDD